MTNEGHGIDSSKAFGNISSQVSSPTNATLFPVIVINNILIHNIVIYNIRIYNIANNNIGIHNIDLLNMLDHLIVFR